MSSLTVNVPVADMRTAADHRSERVSQALYGHVVKSLDVQGDFVLCESGEGYRGWIGRSYLSSGLAISGNVAVVTSLFAVLGRENTGGRLTLPYGARLESGGGELFFDLDGAEITLIFGRLSIDEPVSLSTALEEAHALVSVPYLWGGSSTFGYDCSGFTQAIYRRAGVMLPRDSKDQAQTGREIALVDSLPGDLVFFPGHVAIHLGQRSILHSSRRRGMVAIESLESGHRHYRDDLDGKITTVRRVI